jgi:hypothetical protein
MRDGDGNRGPVMSTGRLMDYVICTYKGAILQLLLYVHVGFIYMTTAVSHLGMSSRVLSNSMQPTVDFPVFDVVPCIDTRVHG